MSRISPPLPSDVRRRMWDIRLEDPDMSDLTEFRIWDIRRRWNVGRTEFLPGWNEICRARKGDRLRVQGVGTPPPDDTERTLLSGALHPDSPRGHVACSPIRTPSDGVSGRPVRTSFAMDSKELSSISDCFGDQKAIKTPKLNTNWLELIARVLSMLIGLKGNNYYSKVFKRVNYKLSNNTFWVVIRITCTCF